MTMDRGQASRQPNDEEARKLELLERLFELLLDSWLEERTMKARKEHHDSEDT